MSECSPEKKTDVDGLRITYDQAMGVYWRVGTKVGRTIYATGHDGWERLIGVMDTPEIAQHVVRAHNLTLQAPQQ